MLIDEEKDTSAVDEGESSASEDNGSSGQGGESGSGEGGGKVEVTKAEYDKLMGRIDGLDAQNRGLVRDLQEERRRRKAGMTQATQFSEVLKFNPEDKKKLEEALAGDDPIGAIVGITQKVIFHEWGKYTTHQGCVTELMERHPDMFDERGRYNPNSEKGKAWEAIATAHPEFKNHPEGVRLAMDELEEKFESKSGAKKAAAKPKDEGEEGEEGTEEGDEGEGKPHVGSGGRKPAPKKATGKITAQEQQAARKSKMSDADYLASKNSKVIIADV